jgi:hypothetical protein
VLEKFFSNTLNGLAYGPKNLWLKPSGNRIFLKDVHPHFISFLKIHRPLGLVLKSLYRLCAFSRLVVPISLKRRLFSSSCVTISISPLASFGGCPCVAQLCAQMVICPSPFERGWLLLPNDSNYSNKIWSTPNGPPNLVGLLAHNSLGIVR